MFIKQGKKLVLLLSLVFLLGCQTQQQVKTKRPIIVTTTSIVSDMVKFIAGEDFEIIALMGPKVDPHSYNPRLSDLKLLNQAVAVFYNGLHLEGKMQSHLEEIKGKPVVGIAESIKKEQLIYPQSNSSNYADPHVWGDPKIWAQCTESIVGVLTKLNVLKAKNYRLRASIYKKRLLSTREWAMKRVLSLPKDKRVLVTSHDAFFYFSKAYGFEVKALQGISTVLEASLKRRNDLVEFLKHRKVRMIFSESSVNSKGVAAIAKKAGVLISSESLFSDAMSYFGDITTRNGETYDRGTYVGMHKHNINIVVEGLKTK